MLLPDKVQAIQSIAPPTTKKQLCSFIGSIINYYRDMWIQRSDMTVYLEPLLPCSKYLHLR